MILRIPPGSLWLFGKPVEFIKSHEGRYWAFCGRSYIPSKWVELLTIYMVDSTKIFELIAQARKTTPLEFLLVTGEVLDGTL